MNDLGSTLKRAAQALEKKTDTPRLDAEILLAHVLDQSRTYLYTYPELQLTKRQRQQFDALVVKRQSGYPIAYLIHTKAFWSLNLTVNEATLIPRPETEMLVSLALQHLPASAPLRILDLGTGTGAIALALATERPDWEVHAIDCCENAIAVARKNAAHHHLDSIHFGISDWFHSIAKQPFDAIMSNPPYIAESDPHVNQGDLRFEPKGALVSGVDGLDAIRILIKDAPGFLKSGGLFMLEHGYNQGEAVATLFKQYQFCSVQQFKDNQGHVRVTMGYA